MKVKNKIFAVTGGGDGMGRRIVLELLNREAIVVAFDINQEALDQTRELASDKKEFLTVYKLDITNKEDVKIATEMIIKTVGHIDGLINNAGIIQPFVKLADLKYETINRVMEVNFFGMLYVIKAFLPHLLTRPEAHIVNISSMGGFLPVPGQTMYGASKAAVKLMTEGLAQELKNTNVKVSVVFPGAIATNIIHNSGLKSSVSVDTSNKSAMVLSPEKAARKIIDGIQNNKDKIFIGKDSVVMNLMYRLNSRFASNLVGRQMNKLIE